MYNGCVVALSSIQRRRCCTPFKGTKDRLTATTKQRMKTCSLKVKGSKLGFDLTRTLQEKNPSSVSAKGVSQF